MSAWQVRPAWRNPAGSVSQTRYEVLGAAFSPSSPLHWGADLASREASARLYIASRSRLRDHIKRLIRR